MMESIFLGVLIVVAFGAGIWAWRLSNGTIEDVKKSTETENTDKNNV